MTKQIVSIVIPCWNSLTQLQTNLPSVFAAAKNVNAEIIIVDDASSDSSVVYLESLGDKIVLVQNPTNQGYAYTVNRAVASASGEIVILLNTDVRPEAECFLHAVQNFTDPTVFAATFNSGESWPGARWDKGLLHHQAVAVAKHDLSTTNPSLWASGGQAAFRKTIWQELGGMDLMYKPFYWEDVDLGYRAWKRGWQIVWDPDSRCKHDHQESVIAGHFPRSLITEIAIRNQILFVWKNITDTQMLLSHLIRLPILLKNYPRSVFGAIRLLPTALKNRLQENKYAKLTDREVLSRWSNKS